MKYEIEEEGKKEKFGFIGMNKFAAKAHGIKWPEKHSEHLIRVYKKVPKSVRLHTIRHEECEEYFMKNYHYNYQKAHQLALKFEKYEIPFPKKDIKEKLIKIGLIK
jgi:hypothetical protein